MLYTDRECCRTWQILLSTGCCICIWGCGGGAKDAGKTPQPAPVANAPVNTPANISSTDPAQRPAVDARSGSSPTDAEASLQAASSVEKQLASKTDTTPAMTPPTGQPEAITEELLFAMVDPAEAGVPFAIDPSLNSDRYAVAKVMSTTRFAIAGPPADDGSAGPRSAIDVASEIAKGLELPAEGFTPVPSAGISASGLPWRIQCDADGSVMALVPGGVFLQGNDGGPVNAAPQHPVYLDAYYIDIAEVSVDQYEHYREVQREAKKRVAAPVNSSGDPHEPVLGVNWGESQTYAHWARKDLPTEAQWEKAARGPNGFEYPWGKGDPLWDRPRTPSQINMVKTFHGDVSPYGVFDMAGNAREWCTDWYSDKTYTQLAEAQVENPRNPTGPKVPSSSKLRVVKGGDPHWAVWARNGVPLTDKPTDVGFRCVLTLKAPARDMPEQTSRVPPKAPPKMKSKAKAGLPSGF